ncbi:MAG: hypothetical protein RLZZ598_686 [Pseudomonadota bacterium]
MALVWALESSSFMVLRNCVRHSVTLTVKAMYSTSAAAVIQAKAESNCTDSSVSTSTTSTIVGKML